MTNHPIDEQLMIDFLLGNLPDEEIERLDELSVTDDDFVNRLKTVEDDLIDAYVRGELPENTLSRFKSNYLRSPKRMEKVVFAETLQKLLNKTPIRQTQEPINKPRWFNFPQRSLRWGLAAAAIVVLTFCGYLIFENENLHNQLRQMQVEKESFRYREQELQRQIAQLEHQSSNTDQGDVKLMAFNLSPPTRAINKIPLLTIPAGIDFVAFTLELDINDFSMYKVALKDPVTGKVLWNSENLKPEKNSVQVKIPTNLLKTQNYLLELSGISGSGAAEIISGYPFKAVTQ
jgi:hypothetical protein